MRSLVAQRHSLGVTPADAVRIEPDRPNVPTPARREINGRQRQSNARAAARAKRSLFRGRRGPGTHGTRERPFLSYTGRGAFFLFGRTKRKNGGRIRAQSENVPTPARMTKRRARPNIQNTEQARAAEGVSPYTCALRLPGARHSALGDVTHLLKTEYREAATGCSRCA